jgi:serine/threonine protein kinase
LFMVLPVALDVAKAMLHLHREGLLHADLKASNVLLDKGPAFDMHEPSSSSSSTLPQAQQQPRLGSRLIGKISDFGLSLMLDVDETHVSHMHGVSDVKQEGRVLVGNMDEVTAHECFGPAAEQIKLSCVISAMQTSQSFLFHDVRARPTVSGCACPPYKLISAVCVSVLSPSNWLL